MPTFDENPSKKALTKGLQQQEPRPRTKNERTGDDEHFDDDHNDDDDDDAQHQQHNDNDDDDSNAPPQEEKIQKSTKISAVKPKASDQSKPKQPTAANSTAATPTSTKTTKTPPSSSTTTTPATAATASTSSSSATTTNVGKSAVPSDPKAFAPNCLLDVAGLPVDSPNGEVRLFVVYLLVSNVV